MIIELANDITLSGKELCNKYNSRLILHNLKMLPLYSNILMYFSMLRLMAFNRITTESVHYYVNRLGNVLL